MILGTAYRLRNIHDFINAALMVPFKENGRDYDGWDCYGLVYCAYRDIKGILLPAYGGYTHKSDYNDLKAAIDGEKEEFEEVQPGMQKPLDIALFSMKSHHPHVALVINNREALHSNGKSGTFIEPLRSAYWNKRIDGFYRLKQ